MASWRQVQRVAPRFYSLLARTASRPVRGEVENGPGMNLPFQTKNKPRLFITLLAVSSFGFSLPFVMVRFQLKKKST